MSCGSIDESECWSDNPASTTYDTRREKNGGWVPESVGTRPNDSLVAVEADTHARLQEISFRVSFVEPVFRP